LRSEGAHRIVPVALPLPIPATEWVAGFHQVGFFESAIALFTTLLLIANREIRYLLQKREKSLALGKWGGNNQECARACAAASSRSGQCTSEQTATAM